MRLGFYTMDNNILADPFTTATACIGCKYIILFKYKYSNYIPCTYT